MLSFFLGEKSGGRERGRGGKAGKVHFIMYFPGGEVGGAARVEDFCFILSRGDWVEGGFIS